MTKEEISVIDSIIKNTFKELFKEQNENILDLKNLYKESFLELDNINKKMKELTSLISEVNSTSYSLNEKHKELENFKKEILSVSSDLIDNTHKILVFLENEKIETDTLIKEHFDG